MSTFAYDRSEPGPAPLGLIVLQVDETIECDMRAMLPADRPLFVTRIPSGDAVTPESLATMQGALSTAAALLPHARDFAAVGYGCTSATAQIGADEVAAQIRSGVRADRVTEPVSALRAACGVLGLARLALLSPYVGSVSCRLRDTLAASGIESPVFGSFEEPLEASVARIDPASTVAAATQLGQHPGIDGIFLSCTNLRTLPAIAAIEAATGLPCLSSNQVLAWHMGARENLPGRLGEMARQA